MVVACFLCLSCLCADSAAPYASNFDKAEVGKVPEEFVVLSGTFTITQADGKKVLELAGEPLDSSGLLFGPENAVGADVTARIWGQAIGRRFPEFAIGAGDAGGYKLWIIPGQAKLELRKAETPVASATYRQWKSGVWTRLRLHVSKSDGGWKIEGKAWPDGAAEPQKWDLALTDPQEPPKGRASLWGAAFSGQPIRFDDLRFTPG